MSNIKMGSGAMVQLKHNNEWVDIDPTGGEIKDTPSFEGFGHSIQGSVSTKLCGGKKEHRKFRSKLRVMAGGKLR